MHPLLFTYCNYILLLAWQEGIIRYNMNIHEPVGLWCIRKNAGALFIVNFCNCHALEFLN